jgi:putative phosphoribosyl transferase
MRGRAARRSVARLMATSPALTRTALFPDRRSAGRLLAARIERLRAEAPVVLAISRDGLPVAHQAARSLSAPLDVVAVRRVGQPGRVVGAVADDGAAVIDHDLAQLFGTGPEELARQRDRAQADAAESARVDRAGREPLDLAGRTVVLVDDVVTAGPAAVAAVRSARRRGAARVVVAAPVLSSSAVARLHHEADEIACLSFAGAAPWFAEPPVR